MSTSYTKNKPRLAGWVVYINGIEVPVSSIDVQFGVWQISTATLRLIPHVVLQRLGFEDRIPVEIYYLDTFFDADHPRMCLLGEYEIVGWTYQTTGVGRFVQIDCKAQLKIFEQLRFFYMSSLNDMVVGNAAATSTAADTYTDVSVLYPLSLFQQGLVRGTGAKEEFIKSPFEFVRNLLRALTAPIDYDSANPQQATKEGHIPRTATGVAGRNFFGRWMGLTDFKRKWAALPQFDDEAGKSAEGCFPLLKAMENTNITTSIGAELGQSVGSAGTAWELFQRVYGTLYMEILQIPAPPAVQYSSKENLVQGKFERRDGEGTYGGLVSHIVKPQCLFGIPPACNIVFPSMIKTYAVSENYESQPTRVYLGEAMISSVLTAQNDADSQALTQQLMITGYPEVVQKRMQEHMTQAQVNTRNFLLYPEELYKGPVSRHTNAPPWLYMLEKVGQRTYAQQGRRTASGRYSRDRGKTYTAATAMEAWGEYVKGACTLFGLDETFFWSLMAAESRFKSRARSKTGAGGIMQMQPQTFYQFYKVARRRNPNLPPIMAEQVIGQQAIKDGKFRPIYAEQSYAQDINVPQKNIYASVAFVASIRDMIDGGVSSYAKDQCDPDREYPSDLQILMMWYNGGIENGQKLQKDRKAYLGGKRAERARGRWAIDRNYVHADFNSHKWKFLTDGSKGKQPHWRYYSSLVYNQFDVITTALSAQPLASEADPVPETPQAPPVESVETTGQDSPVEEVWTPETEVSLAQPQTGVLTETEEGLGELFKRYAKYEYYRARHESRSANLTLAFNPYIIPGFNAAVLDNSVSGFHTIGYVNSVTHSMDAGGNMSTSVVLSYVRTLPEYMKLVVDNSRNNEYQGTAYPDYDVGPTEPIPEVARVFQDMANAESFFGKVLYADLSRASEYVFNSEGMLDHADLSGKALDADTWTPDQGLMSTPNTRMARYFESYDAAMNFVARPVATLDEMIQLRHGKSVDECIKEKTVVGPSDSLGGRYYARVYVRRMPEVDMDMSTIEKITNVAADGSPVVGGAWEPIVEGHGVPDSRWNWDKMLIAYRDVVRGGLAAVQR